MDKQTFIQKAALLQPSYTPSEAVKQGLSQVDLILVVGASGVGKTSIMEHSGIPFVSSDVTRIPRKGEVNGVDYNFRSDYDVMMQEIKDGYFLQYIIYPNGEFYGTKASAYPASGPCTIAVAAATMPLFYEFGFHRIAPVYVVPPTYEEWMKRIDAHHEKDLRPRFIEAKASIEAALADARYYFMVNKDLIESGGMFRDIAYGRVQSDAIAQQGARKTALELLAHVETD